MFDELKKDIRLKSVRENEMSFMESVVYDNDDDEYIDEVIGDDEIENPELEEIIEKLPEHTDDDPPTESDVNNGDELEEDPSVDDLIENMYDIDWD